MDIASQKGSKQHPLRMLDPATFTQRVAENFDQRGGTYDKQSVHWHLPLAEELVRRAQLVDGQVVLDIATGTGLVAELAAKMVGPSGSVLGIDVSPGMLAQAAPKAKAQPNLSFCQADAQTAQFEPASFDVILCSNALVYMLDVPAALKQWASWLRPRGKMLFNTPQSPFLKSQEIFMKAAQAQDLWLEDPAAVVGTPEKVRSILAQAGFQTLQVQVEACCEGGYTQNWTPQELAERLWQMHLRFFPVDSVLSPDCVAVMRQQCQTSTEQLAQQALEEHGSLEELCHAPTMLWVEAAASA